MAARSSGHDDLSGLPSIERVRAALGDAHPHAVLVGVARRAVDAARQRIRAGEGGAGESGAVTEERVIAEARALLAAYDRSLLTPVINATGVLLHTNLGRAPLGPRQLEAVARIAGGYSNLEYDLSAGRRGSRYAHARGLLTALTGAEAALVTNNNAAAVLVTLATLAAGREVIISRGELIEIGGEFRIPDIMETSGARLVEVGTTNRTHLADYERAITTETAAILKVHPSNYRMVGFTAAVSARDIARLASGRKIYLVHDIGSGLISGRAEWASEPTVRAALDDGADVVTFSGDKLLGGPQAGVIVGRAEQIDKIARHPLMRALRVDKMTLAALEETLRIYLEDALDELPLWAMTTATGDELETRAAALVDRLDPRGGSGGSGGAGGSGGTGDDVKVEAVALGSVAGGGSVPGAELGSWGIAITHATRSTAEIERALRFGTPPVIARVEDDRVLLDLRTVLPDQTADLVRCIQESI